MGNWVEKWGNMNIKWKETTRKYFKKYVEEKGNIETPVTFGDHLLKAIKNGEISYDKVIEDVFSLFFTGMETVAASTEHSLVLLAKNKEVQIKVRNEIIDFYTSKKGVSKEDIPSSFSLKDITQLPLFRAMVHELLRATTMAGRGVAHLTIGDSDVEVPGNISKSGQSEKYVIKKGSQVLSNIAHVHLTSKEEGWKVLGSGTQFFTVNSFLR